ncbi:MAG: response regulator [Planctomycetaceae bacterium]|nr:response regulator [Planctomycetaceae bacterium]
MKLQNKTLLITTAAVVLMFGTLFAMSSRLVWNGFAALERQDIRERMARTRRSLQRELDYLARTAADWSSWDATYEFIASPTDEFLRENTNRETLLSLRINVIVFLDADGQLVHADCINLDSEEMEELPADLRDRSWSTDPLTHFRNLTDCHHGVIMLSDGPMLIAARSILTSSQQGPSHGTLLMGRWLNDSYVKRLAELATAPVRLDSLESVKRRHPSRLDSSERKAYIDLVSTEKAEGAFLVDDVYGNPAILCVVEVPRRITLQGRASLTYLAIGLAACGIVFAVLAWRLQAGLVLNRLLLLVGDVQQAGLTKERTPIKVAGNDELALLGKAIDGMVDRLNQNHAQLERARQEAEQASRQKTEFLANMSHEIRTPMTAILGYTELLEESVAGEFERDACRIVRRNGEHLLHIINDILDMSKIEANKMQVEMRSCSPRKIVSEVALLMQVRVAGSKVSLETTFEEPLPERICTDPRRLRQILINLVGNAVKFTPEGWVRIAVRYADPHSPAGAIVFEVADSGVGMTSEQVFALFEPFRQADASTTRKHGGTGLGLAISRSLAHTLGGEISVRSVPKEGSIFQLALPIGSLPERADDGGKTGVAPCESKASTNDRSLDVSSPLRILLVEDGIDNQRLIGLLLRKLGAEVTIAANGREACDLLLPPGGNWQPYRLVLMDMQMPIMDGYEATRRLRLAGCDLPVIALTADAMVGAEAKCREAGCDGYLTKPIDRDRLASVVAEFASVCCGRGGEPAARTQDDMQAKC